MNSLLSCSSDCLVEKEWLLRSPLLKAVSCSRQFWKKVLKSSNKQMFFYRLLIRVIKACQAKSYTEFDAHTTSNCCHGMSIFAKDLITLVNGMDLNELESSIHAMIYSIDTNQPTKCLIDEIPDELVDLASLYALTYAAEQDFVRGRVTRNRKLKEISSVGTDFCNEVVRVLQRLFSNLIAEGYSLYSNELDEKMEISGASALSWGKYVQPEYLRRDKREVRYASSMFSMQVSLAYLIFSRAKIALAIDLVDYCDELKGRYACILEGDGVGQFVPLDLEEMASCNPEEAIVVFGSCAYSDSLDLNSLKMQVTPWLYQFPSLVQAHETHYPQFPRVGDDPKFSSQPITPEEEDLQRVIDKLSKVKGVSFEDPSFCCFTHIFPASVEQVLQVVKGVDESALPDSSHYLPEKFRSFKREKCGPAS